MAKKHSTIQQDIYLSAYLSGKSTKQIADEVGRDRSTVSRVLKRAFRNKLDKYVNIKEGRKELWKRT